METERHRANYIGAPEFFHLNSLCRILNDAFGYHNYLVGSSIIKRDFRDVDIRCILEDEEFDRMFPDSKGTAGTGKGECSWVHDARWSILCASISEWLSTRSNLKVDFQIQRQTNANEMYPHGLGHERHALGLFIHEADRT
jgi:hypothetical protein